MTKDNTSYRFDIRDRCTYWCWLEHTTSLISLVIYSFILIINIIWACKTSSYLKKGYIQLEENDIPQERINNSSNNNMDDPLNDNSKDNNSKKESFPNDKKNFSFLSKEEKYRIKQLRLMRIKCLVYPYVTIILWIIFILYRIIDDLLIRQFDTGNPMEGQNKEKEFFERYPFVQVLVQISVVIHAFLTSTRGIFYGFSFVIFEEKIFFNFFSKCFKNYIFSDDDDESEELPPNELIIKNTNQSSHMSDSNKENNEHEKLDDESKDKSGVMNNSDIY